MSEFSEMIPQNAEDQLIAAKNTLAFETWMPPRKRAKTKEEKEIRKIQRILRNRKAAQKSRDRKRNYVANLEKKCNTMKVVLDQLQSKIDIKSMLIDPNVWDTYINMEQDDEMSFSSTDVPSSTTEISSTLAAEWAVDVHAAEDDVDNREYISSMIQKKSTKFGSIGSDVTSTPVRPRSIEQMTPLTASTSSSTCMSAYISASDNEVDKRQTITNTPLSSASSTPNKYDLRINQGKNMSQSLVQNLFNPAEWPSLLSNENCVPFLMGDLDSFKNDDSFELAIPCEFDHTNSTLTAPQQVGRSTNSLFVEDLKRNPEEITNIVMDDSFINY